MHQSTQLQAASFTCGHLFSFASIQAATSISKPVGWEDRRGWRNSENYRAPAPTGQTTSPSSLTLGQYPEFWRIVVAVSRFSDISAESLSKTAANQPKSFGIPIAINKNIAAYTLGRLPREFRGLGPKEPNTHVVRSSESRVQFPPEASSGGQ